MNNKDKYRLFCESRHVPLFHQAWWLDIVTEGKWDVALSEDKSGDIRAVMPFNLVKKYGFYFSLQAELSPYWGPVMFYPDDLTKQNSLYSFQNRHLNTIIKQLPQSPLYQYYKFLPEFDNWYPFYLAGYEQTTRYTYILGQIKNHENVYAGFSNTLKRQIKKAQKHVKITIEDNICSVFSLVKKANNNEDIKLKLNKSRLQALDFELKKRNQRMILIARDENATLLAGLYLVWDSDKAYLLALGSDYAREQYHAAKLLAWEAVKRSSVYVDKFDFEGSMIEGVERMYKNFGGVKTPYFEIKKYKNRFVKAAFSLLNR